MQPHGKTKTWQPLTLAASIALIGGLWAGCGEATQPAPPAPHRIPSVALAEQALRCRAPEAPPKLIGLPSICGVDLPYYYWDGTRCAPVGGAYGCIVDPMDKSGVELHQTKEACEVAHAICND